MIESGELIERWTHVERVLVNMPEHDRQRHWDMGTWGEVNDCGTVACAAGHCGLDPWFRERGFALQFHGDRADIPPVDNFFGVEGTQRIFLNTARRPVDTVTEEVRQYVSELNKIAALNSARGVPKVGEEWSGQGGTFAGARLGLGGAPDYYMIVGPEYDGQLDWRKASAWAMALVIEGHRDLVLPYRLEQSALFDRVRNLFQPTAYWSCEEHASDSVCAWGQDFDNGRQYYWLKNNKLRARVVRRLTIQ
jgi:hypothetical protein